MSVRVRFAPSPTGALHIGGLRTALFNWLFARHHGGVFVLRIEDTDRTRYVEGSVELLMSGLRWLGLDWDEGPGVGGPFAPYFQSERLALYREAGAALVASGDAYPCWCSPDRLAGVRREQQARGEPPRYDRHCRAIPPDEAAARVAGGEPHVIRFKVPDGETIVVHDLLRGAIEFESDNLDDFILLKSDGFPTYHLANVVDDHAMRITHVLRADEWLPSAPRHLLLYRAFGHQPPELAHLPQVLGADRKKLSKRHGDAAVSEFRDRGFLPEAMFNFLGLLGWSLDDRTEIISRDEFIAGFDLERINRAGGIFDYDKLLWMNGVYIRALDDDELARRIAERLPADLPLYSDTPTQRDLLRRAAPLIKERIKLLSEAAALVSFLFQSDPLVYDVATLQGKRFAGDPTEALRIMRSAREELATLGSWAAAPIEERLRALVAELGQKAGDVFGLLRVAVTGTTVSPPLFESMDALGRERTLARIARAEHLLTARAARPTAGQ